MQMNEIDSLFLSKDPADVFAFYSKFNNAGDILAYVRGRTYNKPRIFEKDGDKDVVAVIPTRDHNGEFAKSFCDIFKGFHIIMAESGNDPYFNYTKNTNLAVEKAVSYDPKWIIVSNDDMYGIDDPAVLRQGLLRLDNGKIDNVWISPEPEHHHCHSIHLVECKKALGILRKVQGAYQRKAHAVLNKFGVDYTLLYGQFKPHYSLFLRNVKQFLVTEDFFVISGKYASSIYNSGHRLYDEAFINNAEDAWLSLGFGPERSAYLEFKIGSKINGTFTPSKSNDARGILEMILFDYKLKEYLHDHGRLPCQ